MIPHPLDAIEELEARRRHPAGRLAPVEVDPHTGRAVPQYIPAAPKPSRRERAVMTVLWTAMAGMTVYVVFAYFAGWAG